LTAYVGLLLRWCNVRESTVLFQIDGRTSPGIENTIGCFTSALYLRIELSEGDSFLDLLRQITAAYCEAREHADSSYFESRTDRPDFTRSTCFNWVPQASSVDLSPLDGSDDALTCSAVAFDHPMLVKLERDTEPFMVLFDTENAVEGNVYYPSERFSAATMLRFVGRFEGFIRAMLTRAADRIEAIPFPGSKTEQLQ
jgi:non-ribosomal peptide synthetase component F